MASALNRTVQFTRSDGARISVQVSSPSLRETASSTSHPPLVYQSRQWVAQAIGGTRGTV